MGKETLNIIYKPRELEKWPFEHEPYVLRESEDFRDAIGKTQMAVNRLVYEAQRAQATLDHLETIEKISFEMIQHNNLSWRELVSEFRSEELYGGSTPSWAESAAPGVREYRSLRGGEDSVSGVCKG